MKKAILITTLAFFSMVCMGQNEGALKFLGIPIDGTEAQFAAKLKGKGFTYNSAYESYKGQFNGKSVDVYIHTNHNLVDRVYVAFPGYSGWLTVEHFGARDMLKAATESFGFVADCPASK